MTREQRWEARKQAKFQQAEFPNGPTRAEEHMKMIPNYPNFENRGPPINTFNPPPQSFPVLSSTYIPDSSIQHLNPISTVNESGQGHKQRTPPSSSFFLNPISDAEEKRKIVLQAYRSEAIQQISKPIKKVKERPGSRTQIIESGVNEDSLRKKAYALELQQQILYKKELNEKRKKSGNGDYFPFGKPGAGAPFRDPSGNIIAVRPPKYNENDPKFMNPNDFYKKATGSPSMNRYYSQPEMATYREPQSVYQEAPPPPQYYQNYPPQYPIQYVPQYSPQAVASYPQYFPQQNPPPPNTNFPAQTYNAPRNTEPPTYENEFRERTNPRMDLNKSLSHSNSPKPGPTEVDDDQEKLIQKGKKEQLAKTLLEQIDEKRRQREEERRQKILEERLEEERLARQRKEIEDGYKREAMNKRKQFQDLQDFNAKSAVVETKAPVLLRRPRSPVEMPPPMPPPPRSRGVIESNFIFQPAQELPVETKFYSADAEIAKIKQEIGGEQQELRNEIFKLKHENLAANEHRFEAQKELQRIKEEMRQKSLREDIRQKEVMMALVNTKNTLYDSNTKLPPFKPTPFKLKSSKSDASLSLDSNRSLPSQTKYIPLGNVEENFPTKNRPGSNEKLKKALNLDSLFPSLPDSAPNNISYEAANSANSSIGISNLNKRNEHRLKVLGKIDDPHDELKQLDDMLLKYLESDIGTRRDSADSNKSVTERRKNPREYKLLSIEEEEADLSLPKSLASDEISLKWYKD